MRKLCLFAAATVIAPAAFAQPVFLSTQNDVLFRYGLSGPIETLQLTDRVIGMARDPMTGVIIAMSPPDVLGGQGKIYRLDNPLSANPTLTLLNNTLVTQYPTATFIGGELYAFRNTDQTLIHIDLTTFAETPVGASGFTGLDRVGGSGYDPVTNTLFAVTGQANVPNALYTVDFGLINGPNPTGSLVGHLGIINESNGAEWHNGRLWAAMQNTNTGDYELGVINVATGAYSARRVLGMSSMDPTGLVVIPAPGAAALLTLAGLAALRRRR